MRTLRNLYYSIPLAEQIPTHSVPTLSDHWLKGYPYLCTLVPHAGTFRLSSLDLINIFLFYWLYPNDSNQ